MNKAVALGYNKEEDPAPKVLAKGSGRTAEAIIAIAEKEGVPVLENKLLTESLYEREIRDYIPEDWYSLVAEILAFVYQKKR